MSMQVTPGFGAFVATHVKGNSHHQEIIAHFDHKRTFAEPSVTEVQYSPGQLVGGEMVFNNATRFANDTSRLIEASITLRDGTQPGSLKLVLYRDILRVQPYNGAMFEVEDGEVTSILAVIDFQAAEFTTFGRHCITTKRFDPGIMLISGDGSNSVRGVLVAANNFTPIADNSVVVGLSVQRD